MSKLDDVLIRGFRKSDLADILDVARLSFAEEFELTGFDENRIRKMVNQMFGIPGRVFTRVSGMLGKEFFKFLVAEVSNKIVGTTMITKQGNMGYVSTIMVNPTYRRQGIAKKLVRSALEYTQRKRMKKAVLHVIPTNLPAKNLYTELGFKDFERIAHLVADIDPVRAPCNAEGIEIGRFRRNHVEAVYDLVRSSEDPKHLEIFDFRKSDLKASLVERIFRFSTRNRMVATLNNRIVGYAEATYTTAEEAGRIDDLHVLPEMRSRGIEESLICSGMDFIRRIGTKKVVGVTSLKRPELISAMKRLGFEKRLELDGMVVELA